MQTATIFNREIVQPDGEAFEDCEFRDCRMVYAGGEPPLFRQCRFEDCDWRFDDAAARALDCVPISGNRLSYRNAL
ncbi:MAG: hypothetical protein CGW95_08330 [Phenylobacterium zucineum]|nr:MAG: hypothetical protein CGW95_08330 [Phenylobacterium zucineum]